jgi:hypothetical protein
MATPLSVAALRRVGNSVPDQHHWMLHDEFLLFYLK